MNFNFTDFSTSFSRMVYPDAPATGMLNLENMNTQRQRFSDRLTDTLRAVNRPRQEGVIRFDQKNKTTVPLENSVEKITLALEQEKGYGFVSSLQSVLSMLSNGNLKEISMAPAGLDALEKLLLNAGFNAADVSDLVADLSEKMEQEPLSLDEVFKAVFELSPETEDTAEQDIMMDASDSLFLESILVSMGLPVEKIQEILAGADQGDKGISLDFVLDELRKIEKQAFYSQQSYQTPASDSQIPRLARQMGLPLKSEHPGVIELNDIVRALETLRQRQVSEKSAASNRVDWEKMGQANEKPADILSELFKSLHTDKENKTGPLFDFSMEKTKAAFADPLQLSGKNGLGQKALPGLNQNNTSQDGAMDPVFKELEALLKAGAKENPASKASPGDVGRSAHKSSVSGEKISDQTQAVFSDIKSHQPDVKIEMPKAPAPAKTLPAYVTQQVGKSLVRAVNQGESSLTIQLKPPELGRLLMTIDNTNNSMRVSIMTENHAAKEIITQNVTELRTVLSNSGVNLERFEVDMSSDFRQSMADARQQAGHSGKRRRNRGNTSHDGVSDQGKTNRISDLAGPGMGPAGSVHLVA